MKNINLESKINAIDLSMVKMKLQDPEEGEGWTQQQTDAVEIQYKQFLLMTASASVVPTKDVDKMWHYHILDTRAYAVDCQEVFGRFIHHFPYLGLRGEEDKMLLSAEFEKTNQLYQSMFDAKCRSGCSSGRCSGAGCIGSCTNHIAAQI